MPGNIWHEARRQEKKLKCMLVDVRKRAERRQEYYLRIKQDPAQFLQVHGRRSNIFMDAAIFDAAESSTTLFPWRGNKDMIIDRFDVRTHLDVISETKHLDPAILSKEEEYCNYERYRNLVQNEFLESDETKLLHAIYLEEVLGIKKNDNSKIGKSKAAIGYNYDGGGPKTEENDSCSDSDSDMEIGDTLINVDELNADELAKVNELAKQYGMRRGQFADFLYQDERDKDSALEQRLQQEEKLLLTGRKSRKDRKEAHDKKLRERGRVSPLSYVRREDTQPIADHSDSSSSRSASPKPLSRFQYITSFGEGEDSTCGPQLPYSSPPPPPPRDVAPPMPRDIIVPVDLIVPNQPPLASENWLPLRYSRRMASHSSTSSYEQRADNVDGVSDQQDDDGQSQFSLSSRSPSYYSSEEDSSSTETPGQQQSKGLTLMEKMKIKMQQALNKTIKEDKKAQQVKLYKKRKLEREREDDIKVLSERLRRIEREKRLKERLNQTEEEGSRSATSSPTAHRSTLSERLKRHSQSPKESHRRASPVSPHRTRRRRSGSGFRRQNSRRSRSRSVSRRSRIPRSTSGSSVRRHRARGARSRSGPRRKCRSRSGSHDPRRSKRRSGSRGYSERRHRRSSDSDRRSGGHYRKPSISPDKTMIPSDEAKNTRSSTEFRRPSKRRSRAFSPSTSTIYHDY